jgi:hypothetical protein
MQSRSECTFIVRWREQQKETERGSKHTKAPNAGGGSLSDAARAPAESLCPPLDAYLIAVFTTRGTFFFPDVDVAWTEHFALLGIEATFDFGQETKLDGIEEFLGVVDGPDVNVCEGGALLTCGGVLVRTWRGEGGGGGDAGRGEGHGVGWVYGE